jgi:hypothetical protein
MRARLRRGMRPSPCLISADLSFRPIPFRLWLPRMSCSGRLLIARPSVRNCLGADSAGRAGRSPRPCYFELCSARRAPKRPSHERTQKWIADRQARSQTYARFAHLLPMVGADHRPGAQVVRHRAAGNASGSCALQSLDDLAAVVVLWGTRYCLVGPFNPRMVRWSSGSTIEPPYAPSRMAAPRNQKCCRRAMPRRCRGSRADADV